MSISYFQFFVPSCADGYPVLSLRSRYALRALTYLAEQAPAPQTTEQIASATGLPWATLAKILQVLSHAGIVRTQRGVGGGIELVRQPQQLSVKEVVDALDPSSCSAIHTGMHNAKCLQRRLQVVMALAERVLQETTVAELVPHDQQTAQPAAPIDSLLEKLAQAMKRTGRSDAQT